MTTIGGLLDTAKRALNTQTQAIRVVGDNIANVNTPGYSRRRGDIVTEPAAGAVGVEVGLGVNLDRSVRIVDEFLNKELGVRISDRAFAEIRDEILKRAESSFALDGATGRVGYQFNDFFAALEDLQTNPADIPLRTQVIQKGSDLVNSIRQTYNQLASLQREADQRTGILIEDVNRLTRSIATVNFEITKADTSNQEALTLRDQRDQLMRDLSELVSFNSVENTDGTILIYLQNGFPLVNGSSNRDLAFSVDSTLPPGLDGNPIRQVTFEFNPGPPPIYQDLTNVIAQGQGEIGGLLALRGVQTAAPGATTFDADGELVRLATRIEYMTRDLLTRFNTEYLGLADVDGVPATLEVAAYDLDGNAPTTVGDQASIYALFSFEGLTNIAPAVYDADSDGVPELTDLDNIIANVPSVSSFSRILTFNVSDEREFAAGRDVDTTTNGVQVATGDASNVNGVLSLRRNAVNYNDLGALSGNQVTYASTTIEDLYGLTASNVGALSARAADDVTIFGDREAQVRELQQSVSGVNLDEEFAKLINFQRGFEAAARMIRVGDDLFTQILQLLG
ncbi:MAG: flagellar hook-associated protein FlgK [Bdellovibrionales bacterium]|nr:flagellar hook-associated protein FlgK [Bdellovibrionales bacterium]